MVSEGLQIILEKGLVSFLNNHNVEVNETSRMSLDGNFINGDHQWNNVLLSENILDIKEKLKIFDFISAYT